MNNKILKNDDTSLNWSRQDRKLLHQNRIFSVVSYQSTSSDNSVSGEFYSLETNDWVNVIAMKPNGNIILVNQFRHGLGRTSLEFPGGIVEKKGEDRHLQSAMAELREETGYTSTKWTLLGKMGANPGILNNECYVFLALDAIQSENQEFDLHERIELYEYPATQITDLVKSGELYHSIMIAALGLFLIHNAK